MSTPGHMDSRHLGADADWPAVAEWCGGVVGEDDEGRFMHTAAGKAREGSWIVSTPENDPGFAVYFDRDYRGFLALLARREGGAAAR